MDSIRITRFVISLCLAASTVAAQTNDSTTGQKTCFTRRDAGLSGVALAGSGVVSIFDERIERWARSPRVQGSTARHDAFENLTAINEVPLTIGAVAVYGLGRLSGSNVTAKVGLHATEALVLTVATSELIRAPLGRSRPRESPNDAYKFSFGGGFTDFGKRSYPSLHAAVGFATASVLTGELQERHPDAVPFAAPVLFAAALVPGATRMYLDQHWASDVVAGAFLGTLMGSRVVSYAYSHRTSKLDRALLAVSVLPDGHGGMMIMKSLGY
jgi:membrane-associated phospholipid phosphatase